MDLTIGRKGFAIFVKAMAGSNVIKVVPASGNGNASGSQVADKRLKVVCGANTSFLKDGAWIGEKTPNTFADVIISPNNAINPNIGSLELAEAINRVLPFTATEENRPILHNVLFLAGDGKLTLIASDGFRLAMVGLDYGDGAGDGQVLVHRDDLKGIANALRKARRVRVGIEPSGEELDGQAVVIETEAIRYRFIGGGGNYPDYAKIIPTDHSILAHLDSVEAGKAVALLKAMADNPKSYSIDLLIGDGNVLMSSPDDNVDTSLAAETEGQGEIRVDGKYLADVLKVCGGMVDLTLTNAYSPMRFSTDGFSVGVMPMMSPNATEQKRQEAKAKQAEAEATAEPTAEATAEAKAKAKAEAKAKAKAKKTAVAVS